MSTCWVLADMSFKDNTACLTFNGYLNKEAFQEGKTSADKKIIEISLLELPTWLAFQNDLVTYIQERTLFQGGGFSAL